MKHFTDEEISFLLESDSKTESSLGSVQSFAGGTQASTDKPDVYMDYPAYPKNFDDFISNDVYNDLDSKYYNSFFESYFSDNKYSGMTVKELLEVESDDNDEEEDSHARTQRVIDKSEKKLADDKFSAHYKKAKEEREKNHPGEENKSLSASTKNKAATVLVAAKSVIKDKSKDPGKFPTIKKIVRTAIWLGITYGFWLMPWGIISKLIVTIVGYAIHASKEDSIRKRNIAYVSSQIDYYRELEEKTDDPEQRKRLKRIRTEYELQYKRVTAQYHAEKASKHDDE